MGPATRTGFPGSEDVPGWTAWPRLVPHDRARWVSPGCSCAGLSVSQRRAGARHQPASFRRTAAEPSPAGDGGEDRGFIGPQPARQLTKRSPTSTCSPGASGCASPRTGISARPGKASPQVLPRRAPGAKLMKHNSRLADTVSRCQGRGRVISRGRTPTCRSGILKYPAPTLNFSPRPSGERGWG